MTEASGFCTLEAVVGSSNLCPGPACAFWNRPAGACVLDGVQHELRDQPALVRHLLELRSALQRPGEAARSRFSHLLNEELEAEAF